MAALRDPGLAGDVAFDRVTYASAGLNYGGPLAGYVAFNAPHPSYVTQRINIAAFANLGFGASWPFSNTNVPLNGHISIPRGRGPFPLAVFVHGNHGPLENSTPGYLYLCDLLASHGILAATIDANFLNGGNFGENDARGIVHLEHVKQFRAWNGTAAHPLHGKVDLNRVLLVGHSRGGEGAGHASLFNRLSSVKPDVFSPIVPLDGSAGLGPYRFGLTVVAAIAPTDRQYEPVSGATTAPVVVPDHFYLIHGSRDADVSDFQGYNTYNRAHAVDAANATVSGGKMKALLWVYGANHNQFNSVWAPEGAGAMSRPDQEQIARAHIGALAQAWLLGRREYVEVQKDHALAVAWVPSGSQFVSQYQDPDREFVMHAQEPGNAPVVSLPVQGVVAVDPSVTPVRQNFNLVNSGAGTTTLTLRVVWTASGGRLVLTFDPATLHAERYRVLSLRVGQSVDASNTPGRDQDFTLEVSSGSRTMSIPASELHRIVSPDLFFGTGKTVMQTLRLPIQRLVEHGVEPSDLRAIALEFDQRPTGRIFVGDIQVSN